jgi:Na+-transporting methylmalonyl-CoA/oxaloacetate decarboxylase beta subunit
MGFAYALRTVAESILAGVVFVGIAASFVHGPLPIDPHWIGAGLGAVAGIFAIAFGAFESEPATQRNV